MTDRVVISPSPLLRCLLSQVEQLSHVGQVSPVEQHPLAVWVMSSGHSPLAAVPECDQCIASTRVHLLGQLCSLLGPGNAIKPLVATSVQLLQNALPRQYLLHRTSVLAQLNYDLHALSLAVVALDSPSQEEENQA